jgi:hypothetical protein
VDTDVILSSAVVAGVADFAADDVEGDADSGFVGCNCGCVDEGVGVGPIADPVVIVITYRLPYDAVCGDTNQTALSSWCPSRRLLC